MRYTSDMKTYAAVAPGQPPSFENTTAIFVVDNLDDLTGPSEGTLKLPVHLDWSEFSSYNISRPNRLRSLYATVLREAASEQDIISYVNAQLLKREWLSLNLPRAIRSAWEQRHPELRP